ncbi:MAG: BtpA/SgcQ family protein [Nitrososphaerota archaeon]|nr:BtpA/SgcQ family protein [Nitrososphaerota archaeon]
MVLEDIFSTPLPIVGMVHLSPLPGSPRYGGRMDAVVKRALEDARALEEGGVDGLLVENLGDVPYHKDAVPPETVASMARVLGELGGATGLPLGVNVLRNACTSALALAHSFGARFIRANVLSEAFVTDQGIIEGCAERLLRARKALGAEEVQIWADVHVKHAFPLFQRSIQDSARDMVQRSLADALIVTGERTGAPPSFRDLKAAEGLAPVVVGSGLETGNARSLLAAAGGGIVGTHLKEGSKIGNPVDVERVRAFMEEVKRVRAGV